MHSSMAYYDVDENELPPVDNDPRMRYCVRKGVKVNWQVNSLLPQIAEGKILIGVSTRQRCYCWLEFKQFEHTLMVMVHAWDDACGTNLYQAYFNNTTLTLELIMGLEGLAHMCIRMQRMLMHHKVKDLGNAVTALETDLLRD